MVDGDSAFDKLPYLVRRRMDEAMMAAMKMGRNLGSRDPEPDFDALVFAAAWEWMHYFRDAGKVSAYGPMQQAINDEANSHALRGFVVGWSMCQAMHEAQGALEELPK